MNAFPDWKTGYIAREPEIDRNRGRYLIDAGSEGGMSGSPVLVRQGSDLNSTRLLGVYSCRLTDGPVIGQVWDARVIEQLIEESEQV